jgi:hypothetical protein
VADAEIRKEDGEARWHLGMRAGPMRNLIDNFWIDVIDNFLAIINPHFPAKPPSTKTYISVP